MKYTQDRDEYGTTQQEREVAKLLSIDKVRQIQIARQQGISRQRVGQLKDVAINKNLIKLNGDGYDITEHGIKVLGLATNQYAETTSNGFSKIYDKRFDEIVKNQNMSDIFDNVVEEEE